MYNIVVGREDYKIVLLEENMIDNRKLKVYLDTSVISYLKQDDAPEKTGITLNLWEKFKTGVYDICISQITIDEMNECPEPKLSFLKTKLSEIKYINFKLDDKCFELAKEIIEKGILPRKSIDDSYHIAIAMINGCDIITSWNFKHIVNIQTINGTRTISQLKGYKDINILNPLTLLEMEV